MDISFGFGVGVILLFTVLVFLVIREFWCWFYKSNEIKKNTELTLMRLEKLSEKVDDLSKKLR